MQTIPLVSVLFI